MSVCGSICFVSCVVKLALCRTINNATDLRSILHIHSRYNKTKRTFAHDSFLNWDDDETRASRSAGSSVFRFGRHGRKPRPRWNLGKIRSVQFSAGRTKAGAQSSREAMTVSTASGSLVATHVDQRQYQRSERCSDHHTEQKRCKHRLCRECPPYDTIRIILETGNDANESYEREYSSSCTYHLNFSIAEAVILINAIRKRRCRLVHRTCRWTLQLPP